MIAKDEHKKATKSYEKSVSSFQKKVAKHQSLAEADEDDAIYHAAAARFVGMRAFAQSSAEAEEPVDPYMKKDDDFEATEEDIQPVVAKKPNASQHVLKRLTAKPSLHL